MPDNVGALVKELPKASQDRRIEIAGKLGETGTQSARTYLQKMLNGEMRTCFSRYGLKDQIAAAWGLRAIGDAESILTLRLFYFDEPKNTEEGPTHDELYTTHFYPQAHGSLGKALTYNTFAEGGILYHTTQDEKAHAPFQGLEDLVTQEAA